MKNSKKDFKSIQNHLKTHGFVFQGSEIYGGLANTWDYGPLGTLLNKNIKDLWFREYVSLEENVYPLDSKILMNPQVWVASGHVSTFSDPLIENKTNGKRYRADHIIEEVDSSINAEAMSKEEMEKYIKDNVKKYDGVKTDWTSIREFHLMFETKQGVVEDDKSLVYLRPETAQGIFVNFKNIQRSMRAKLPFGVAQIGKSFRNEVTPGNFTFRTREFEQMELEYFVKPGEDNEAYNYYIDKSWNFIKNLGIKEPSLKKRIHHEDELAHYSKGTVDIEFEFPFGWGELMGIANRTNFDLQSHMKHSGQALDYHDPITNDKYVPYVIEPSVGMDRLALAIIVDAYEVEELESGTREVLRLNKDIAPYKLAILPLVKKYHAKTARKIFRSLMKQGFNTTYDETGSIGKRYRRQDAIGTPFVITIIDETEKDGTITIRYRDSMKQETININNIHKYL